MKGDENVVVDSGLWVGLRLWALRKVSGGGVPEGWVRRGRGAAF